MAVVASCDRCLAVCPADALSFGEDAITVDVAACTGCGGCVSACPESAIQMPEPEPLRLGEAAIAVCAQHPAAAGHPGAVGCLRHWSLSRLAALWANGVRHLQIACGDCAQCPDRPADETAPVSAPAHEQGALANAHSELSGLLADRGLAPMSLAAARAEDLRQWQRRAEPAPQPGRRALLLGRTASPEAADSGKALAEMQARPSPPDAPSPRFAHVPVISALGCTGCDACIRLCPQDALGHRPATSEQPARYVADPALCTACGLCVDSCDDNAISLLAMHTAPAEIALRDFRCSACGVACHEPDRGDPQDNLCRICRQTGHHKKLFQVLT